jgi:hypothetical protein
MSARELCRQWGVSERMYQEFLVPTLLVGLFAPPEEVRGGRRGAGRGQLGGGPAAPNSPACSLGGLRLHRG